MSKKPNILGSCASLTSSNQVIFETDPLYTRLDGIDADVGNDLLGLFKYIDGFRDARDDRALETFIRQRMTGKVFVLENMSQSDFYNRSKDVKRTIPSRHCLSQHNREAKGLDDISKLTYSDAEKLNRMWNLYATRVSDELASLRSANASLDSCSLPEFVYSFLKQHLEIVGASIEIVQAQNPQLTGISGIVIREMENAFELISLGNKHRIIPKEVVTIRLLIPDRSGFILRGPDLAGIGRTGSTYRQRKTRQKNSL